MEKEISPGRRVDMAERKRYLDGTAGDLKDGLLITAKSEMQHAAWLANRIKTHDYTQEDKYLAWEKQWITR